MVKQLIKLRARPLNAEQINCTYVFSELLKLRQTGEGRSVRLECRPKLCFDLIEVIYIYSRDQLSVMFHIREIGFLGGSIVDQKSSEVAVQLPNTSNLSLL